jgi:hypothetical protein
MPSEWTDLVDRSNVMNATSTFHGTALANFTMLQALNASELFQGSELFGPTDESLAHPLLPSVVFGALLSQSVSVDGAAFRRPPGPRGGGALFVVQEQDDLTQFELLTDSCVFQGNDSPDILFGGLCTWLSFEDIFWSVSSSAFALSDSLHFCRNNSCGIAPIFFGSKFKGVSAPAATRRASLPPPPPQTVVCDATDESEPNEVTGQQGWTMPPTLTSGGVKLGWMTMPPTRMHRFPSPTVTATEGRSPTLMGARPTPIFPTQIRVSSPQSPSASLSLTGPGVRVSLSFTYSVTRSVSQSASLALSMVASLTNVLTFSVSPSVMLREGTLSHTLVVYTQWEPSYVPVTTLALTWADFPIWLTTRVVTPVYVPVSVEVSAAAARGISDGLWKGVVIGVASGVAVIIVMLWFWCRYATRADTATTGSDMQSVGLRDVMIIKELKERVENPFFCGVSGGDHWVDPFVHDFDTDCPMFE